MWTYEREYAVRRAERWRTGDGPGSGSRWAMRHPTAAAFAEAALLVVIGAAVLAAFGATGSEVMTGPLILILLVMAAVVGMKARTRYQSLAEEWNRTR